jgi:hypothetical protein
VNVQLAQQVVTANLVLHSPNYVPLAHLAQEVQIQHSQRPVSDLAPRAHPALKVTTVPLREQKQQKSVVLDSSHLKDQ